MTCYEKPMLVQTEQMSEGVYLASGADGDGGTCYTTTARIHQTPETGRGDYRIQVDGHHSADHTREAQTLTISFNLPVEYVSSNGSLVSGDNSTTLVIGLRYHQNPNDNIGFGDLIVKADPGLAITGAKITD